MRECFLCDAAINGAGYRRTVPASAFSVAGASRRGTASGQGAALRVVCEECAAGLDAGSPFTLSSAVAAAILLATVGFAGQSQLRALLMPPSMPAPVPSAAPAPAPPPEIGELPAPPLAEAAPSAEPAPPPRFRPKSPLPARIVEVPSVPQEARAPDATAGIVPADPPEDVSPPPTTLAEVPTLRTDAVPADPALAIDRASGASPALPEPAVPDPAPATPVVVQLGRWRHATQAGTRWALSRRDAATMLLTIDLTPPGAPPLPGPLGLVVVRADFGSLDIETMNARIEAFRAAIAGRAGRYVVGADDTLRPMP